MEKYKYIQKYDYSSFIFIIGGAFQGKSLLSIRIAERYTISTIICTDYLRNVLRSINPCKEILRSTSNLDKISFNRSREIISDLLFKTIHFYALRKEKVIIEGIHFSRDFLKFAVINGAKCICLENCLPWEKKVELKSLTSPITKIINIDTGEESLAYHNENLDTKNNAYLHKRKNFQLVHDIISSDANSLKIEKVSFEDIDKAFLIIKNILDKHFPGNHIQCRKLQ